ncbi:MAG: DUF4365 domain-containing protein [Crocinitomicaceae bacterium]|nr:DUF4365 domain-containing protein [Crocinitomicaceae bacterium]
MSGRVNEIDQLGTNKLGVVVSENLKWIYRPQPMYDVGIDALLEEVVGGNPTGRFIAVQLKSGPGHFRTNKKYLTLKVSKVHRNYWLGLSIPIILVGYLPANDHCIWEVISEKTLKRALLHWKLEIPKHKLLNSKSLIPLSKLVQPLNDSLLRGYNRDLKSNDVYDLVENMRLLRDSAESVNNVNDIMENLTIKIQEHNVELHEFIDKGMSNQNREVQSVYKAMGKDLKFASTRIRGEIDVFSETFGLAISALHLGSEIYKDITDGGTAFDETQKAIASMAPKIPKAVASIKFQEKKVKGLPDVNNVLTDGRDSYLSTVGSLIDEYSAAYDFVKYADVENGG